MRKIVAGLFVSLDGVAESPDRWVFPYFTEEVGAVVNRGMERADAVLLGRRTYQEWAEYWPDKTAEDDPFAPFINQIPKFVVSGTLRSPDWEGSSLIPGGSFREEISRLTEQPGGDILVQGSITLVGSLLRAGLLDELSVLVFPVVVGNGKRLFEAPEQVPLELVESTALDNGVLSLVYRPTEE